MKSCITNKKINVKHYPKNIRDVIEDLPRNMCNKTRLIIWLEDNFNKTEGRTSLIIKLSEKNVKIKNFHYQYSFLNDTMYFYIRIYDKIDSKHSNISFYVPAIIQ